MADPIQSIKDWWFNNVTAPQTGDARKLNFFQYRANGNPGAISNILDRGAAGQTWPGEPSGYVAEQLRNGPPTDRATAQGLVQLKSMWDARGQSLPKEQLMVIDPKFASDRNTYAHEAAHSLFNQIQPDDYDVADNLNKRARESGIGFSSSSPFLDATEALGSYVSYPWLSQDPKALAYFQAVIAAAKTPEQKRAAVRLQQLLNMVNTKIRPIEWSK